MDSREEPEKTVQLEGAGGGTGGSGRALCTGCSWKLEAGLGRDGVGSYGRVGARAEMRETEGVWAGACGWKAKDGNGKPEAQTG